MMRKWSSVFLAAAAVSTASSAVAASFRASPAAQQAKKDGRTVVKEITADIDGDGVDEYGVVERFDGRMRLVIYERVDDDEFERVLQGTARPAQRLVRLEKRRMVGTTAPELVAVFEEATPDETALSLRIVSAPGGTPKEIFAQTFFLPRTDDRQDIVALGDAKPHYFVEERDGGDADLVWVRKPQILEVPGQKGPVRFAIGAHRTVYRYDPRKQQYVVEVDDEVDDFLEVKLPRSVDASVQSPKIWGTAQSFWGTDDDPSTSWNVPVRKARGAELSMEFASGTEVRMIRIVPGCALDAAAWAKHAELSRFHISLSSGRKVMINRKSLNPEQSGLKALGEFPLNEGFGRQILVFFDKAQPIRWAKLEVDRITRRRGRGRVGELCISDVTFH